MAHHPDTDVVDLEDAAAEAVRAQRLAQDAERLDARLTAAGRLDEDAIKERFARLRAPFEADELERKPKALSRNDQDKGRCEDTPAGRQYSADGHYCGGWHARAIHLDYVGHAGLTMRLLDVDPFWSWSFMHVEFPQWAQDLIAEAGRRGEWDVVHDLTARYGAPLQRDGGVWIRLTILGVTRTGFGDAEGKVGPNAVKELIGDALRNAAMRFGVATYLWSKSDRALSLRDVTEPDSVSVATSFGAVIEDLRAASQTEDPIAALSEVLAVYGRRTLEQVPFRRGDGSVVSAYTQYLAAVEWFRAHPKQADETDGDEQAPATSDDTPDARAQDPEDARTTDAEGAREEEQVRAHDAQPDAPAEPDTRAHAAPREDPAARMERARAAAQEVVDRQQERSSKGARAMRERLFAEVEGHAAVFGVQPGAYLASLFEGTQHGNVDPGQVPDLALRRAVLNARPKVVAAMREQGRATEADALTQAGTEIRASWESLTNFDQASTAR